MRPDITPIPRPNLFDVVHRALGKVLSDLVFSLATIGAIMVVLMICLWLLEQHTVVFITSSVVCGLIGAVAWRAFEIYEQESRNLIDRERISPSLREYYDADTAAGREAVVTELMTKLQFTRDQAEAWVKEHS